MYNLLNDTDYAYLMNQTIHRVDGDNLEPDYNVDDILILKKEYTYNEGDVILFKYYDSYKLGIVNDIISGEYILSDNTDSIDEDYEVTDDNVYGKVTFKLKGFGIVYNILISPFMIVFTFLLVGAYYFLTMGDRA